MPNYLVLMKSQRTEKPVAGNRPSPEQMQQQGLFAAYKVWMTQFKDNIVNMGDKLLPGGRVLTMSSSGLADGPFIEGKEVIGEFMIISAKDEAGAAVEVVRACPAVQMPGAVLEIREARAPRCERRRWRTGRTLFATSLAGSSPRWCDGSGCSTWSTSKTPFRRRWRRR